MPQSAHVFAIARSLAVHTLASIRADAALYFLVFTYTTCGLAFVSFAGAGHTLAYGVYVTRWLLLFGLVFPAIALTLEMALILHRFDRKRRLAVRRVFSPPRVGRFLAGLVLLQAMLLFQGTFTSVKNTLVSWWGGFPYDRVLADIDNALHFGVDPWRWLYGVAQYDWFRIIIGWNYNVLWFVLSFGALFYVATSWRADGVRLRYLLAFMLVWIVVGNLLAGEFMSAGPAFYGFVTGDTGRFADQLSFLAHGLGSPNSAASYQRYLWELHEAGQTGFGSGIAAFPSVHVAVATLNALFLAEYSRRLGVAGFAYVAFIIASSVYLGWHYAIDGYAAVAIVLAIYFALRRAFAPARGAVPAAAILPA